MIRGFEYRFNYPANVIFDYLALSKDIQKWWKSKCVVDFINKYDGDRYTGFEVEFKVDDMIGKSVNEVTEFIYGKEVRFREVEVSFRNKQYKPIGIEYPYHVMGQRLRFFSIGSGTLLKHQIYFEPKGLFSWLKCYFILFYSAKKEAIKACHDLAQYLESNTWQT